MTIARPLRTMSALLGTASLVALLSLAATPATAAEPWTPPVEVGDSYGDAGATVVAPNGTITVLTESNAGIVSISSTDGGLTWATPVAVGSGGDYAFRPAIGVSESGLLTAAWVEELSGVRTIEVAVSDDGGTTWAATGPLPTVTTYVDNPVVGSANALGFTIVWNESFTKLSSTSTDGGVTWGSAQVITQNMNSYNPASLAATGSGGLVVVFQEFDGMAGRYSIQSKVSTDAGATWGTKVAVGEDWSGGLGNGYYSYAISPADGTAVAVWDRPTATGQALFVTTSTDGGATWSTQFIAGDEAGQLRYVDAKPVDGGSVGLLWHSSTMDGATLYYATVTPGSTAASTPVVVTESPDFAIDYLPSFSSLGDVRVASWLEYTDASTTYRTSVSCDAGATWSPSALLVSDTWDMDAQTTVSGTTFTAYWSQEGSGPSDQSLFASSLSGACGAVVPPGPALAATGSSLAPVVVLAGLALAVGVGLVAARRRAEA